jgi:hypothetical protein
MGEMAKLLGGAKALLLRGHGAVGAKRWNGWNDWNALDNVEHLSPKAWSR